MRLLLVRHGETEANRQGLALGRADVPLTDKGRQQATLLAAALASEPIVALYSSPLTRAMETAAPIAAAHQLQVEIEPALIEMDIGELDGLTFPELRQRHPDLLDRWTGYDGPNLTMPGGERLLDVQSRATEALRLVTERHAGTVCLVTHNFVILSLLADLLRIELWSFRRFRQGVAAITVLELNRNQWRVVRFNDACHLRD